MNEALIQGVGAFFGAFLTIALMLIDQYKRKRPNRVQEKIEALPVHTVSDPILIGKVYETSAIQAQLLQQTFEKVTQVETRLTEMEAKVSSLTKDNSSKAQEIDKLKRRVKLLEDQLRRNNIEPVKDTGALDQLNSKTDDK